MTRQSANLAQPIKRAMAERRAVCLHEQCSVKRKFVVEIGTEIAVLSEDGLEWHVPLIVG